jgi:hypothetical protein
MAVRSAVAPSDFRSLDSRNAAIRFQLQTVSIAAQFARGRSSPLFPCRRRPRNRRLSELVSE